MEHKQEHLREKQRLQQAKAAAAAAALKKNVSTVAGSASEPTILKQENLNEKDTKDKMITSKVESEHQESQKKD